MEQCPQCGTERVTGENFCDSCGHKYSAGVESQDQQQQQPESVQQQPEQAQDQQQQEPVQQQQPEQVQVQPESEQDQQQPEPVQQQPESAQDQDQQQQQPEPATSGRLSMRDSDGAEILSIRFEDAPKTIGRQDVSDILTSQGKDPLQVSRKHCTIFREGDDYYIEDGTTPVQEKPSGNHTTVNGKDITGQGRVKLADNDSIVLAMLAETTFCL